MIARVERGVNINIRGVVSDIQMDFLKAAIEKKKKQIEDSKVLVPDKKYFKRGDLAAKHEEEYWKRHKRFKLDETEEGSSAGELSEAEAGTSSQQDKDEEKYMLPRKEVIRRLRDRGEPIRLYGETDYEAYQRLKKLEIMEPESNKGYKNDMKAAMDKVDEDYLQEILKASGETEVKSNDVKVVDDGIEMEDIVKMAEKMGTGDAKLDCDVILKFLKLILKCWATELNSRPLEEKRGFQGKLESATHSQTVSYLKPLFRKLKRRDLSPDILSCMVDIIKHMINRDYIKASDAYLEMAIGNAPWPIGVTMVGIHARTGREKIFARNVAHVLNDETQRKYIQAMKRLMTHCQRFFPTDPSHSVNFEGPVH